MAHGIETTYVYLDTQSEGVVTCLACGVKRPVNMAHYPDYIGGKSLKVKCNACGSIFSVRFDFRKLHRRTVQLPGTLLQSQPREELSTITVTSLSAGGLAFVTKQEIPLQPGERYEVIFFLNDRQLSRICEEIVIKYRSGSVVGAAFYHSDRYSYDLDFYLMPQMSTPWSA